MPKWGEKGYLIAFGSQSIHPTIVIELKRVLCHLWQHKSIDVGLIEGA